MSTTLIEKLVAAGTAIAGKVLRVIAGQDPAGDAQAIAVDAAGRTRTVHGPIPSAETARLTHRSIIRRLQKGGQTKIRTRLPVLGESQESSRTAVGTVTTNKLLHGVVTGGPFIVGEIVTGGTSLATGAITVVGSAFLEYSVTAGIFVIGETVTGGTSLAVTTTTAVTTPNIVGQIVKIPQNNVDGLLLTVESSPDALAIDEFEAPQPTMQLMWPVTGLGALPAVRETGIVHGGSASMKIDDAVLATYTHSIMSIGHGVVVGSFALGETITGATSGATATVGLALDTNLRLVSVVGIFVLGETITGSTSGATATTTGPVSTTEDMTNFESISFQMFVNQKTKDQFVDLTISDGINSASITLGNNLPAVWERKTVNLIGLAAAGLPAVVNLTAITTVVIASSIDLGAGKFKPEYLIYIDDLFTQGFPGSLDLKFHDMGATLPVAGVATLSGGVAKLLGDLGISGSQSLAVRAVLRGGKQQINIEDFAHGVAGEITTETFLTPGNYYAITANYVDADAVVYGADPVLGVDFYPPGYAFTVPDEISPIVQVGALSDCMFALYASVPAWIDKISLVPVGDPGIENFFFLVAEDAGMRMRELASGPLNRTEELSFIERPAYLPAGGKIEIYYSDEFNSAITHLCIVARYWAASHDSYVPDP